MFLNAIYGPVNGLFNAPVSRLRNSVLGSTAKGLASRAPWRIAHLHEGRHGAHAPALTDLLV